jgi:hypothetical protein
LLGAAGFAGCILSIPMMRLFERKSLFQLGHFINFVVFIVLGNSITDKNGHNVLVCLIVLEISYCATNGTVFWLYVAEITGDKALGISIFFRMATLLIL